MEKKKKVSKYKILSRYIGIDFWNPNNGDIVSITGKNIEWFEKEFSTKEGYTHFFYKEE